MVSVTTYASVDRPLTIAEVDDNFTDLAAAINAALSGVLPVSSVVLREDAGGQFLRFMDSEGTTLADVPFPAMLVVAGIWSEGAAYTTRHLVDHEGGVYVCAAAHTAGTFADDLDAGKWFQLGTNAAGSIAFVPGGSGLDSTTTQDAIVELAEKLTAIPAGNVTYDHTTSGLAATDVKGALDELAARGGGAAGDIAFTPTGSISSTTVQAAIAELDGKEASDINIDPISGVTGSTVQDALESLKTLIGSGGGSSDAADIDVAAISGISSDNVQGALEELAARGTGGSVAASAVTMTSISGLDTTNVQTAIADLKGKYNAVKAITDVVQTAEGIAYDGSISGADNVQDALEELKAEIDGLSGGGGGVSDAADVAFTPASPGGLVGDTVEAVILELNTLVNGNKPAGSVTYTDDLGEFGSTGGTLSVQDALTNIVDALRAIRSFVSMP